MTEGYFPIIPLVPLCKKQLQNVRNEDIIHNPNSDNLFRLYNVKTIGNRIDKFPEIFQRRFGIDTGDTHFIAQVYGCTFECPYCYVTQEGIWGKKVELHCAELIYTYRKTSATVFRLTGGAPALYLNSWVLLIELLAKNKDLQKERKVFHSNFLLNEGLYNEDILWRMNRFSAYEFLKQLYAVSIKSNNITMLQLENMKRLYNSGVNFYVTFTAMCENSIETVKEKCVMNGLPEVIFKDSYTIPIKMHKALK